MSSKKDERDIDEILASINEMLAEKDGSFSETDERKENIEQAARESEGTLGLSSSADKNTDTPSKLQPFEPLDKPSEPRQRIVLTEEYLEPSAQESLPLWAAQTSSSQDEPEPKNEPESTSNETTADIETPESDDMVEALNPDDELSESIGDLDDLDLPELNDVAEEQIPESEAIPLETVETKEEPTEPDTLKEEAEDKEAKTEPAKEETNTKTDEFDAVFDAIAADDTITFDINEAMEEDTVYDIQVLDNELVEAFVRDVVHEDEAFDKDLDNASSEQNIETSPEDSNIDELDIEETSHDETNPSELDDSSVTDMNAQESSLETIEENTVENIEEGQAEAEVVTDADETANEVEGEISEDTVTEQVTKVVEQQNSDELISLNPDELDPLIEAVSDEVRIKINQHLQQILPELISDALLEHLANQSDKQDD